MSTLAQQLYTHLMCAEGFEEQIPESKYAKNTDLLWFLLPIVGTLLFFLVIEERYRDMKKRGVL